MEKIVKVIGMNCAHCEAKIDKGLNALDGVSAVVDLDNKSVAINSELSNDEIIQAIEEIGYKVESIA